MYIDIFLASSINELHKERMEVGAFIQEVNTQLIRQGRYVRLYLCEDMSDAIATENKRKQEEYNETIRRSHIFLLMVDRKVGEYTMEEFYTASRQHEKCQFPRIYVFFKRSGEHDAQEFEHFRKTLLEKQYEYEEFKTIDLVKQKLEEEIMELFAQRASLE